MPTVSPVAPRPTPGLTVPLGTAQLHAVVVAGVLGSGYLLWNPSAPDLAAQVARANVAATAHGVTWWTGWFGGLSLPSYSLLAPASMAWLGVHVVGVLAVLVAAVAAGRLLHEAARPRAGAISLTVMMAADLVDGRVTFTAGMAAAVVALLPLRARRPVTAAALAIVCFLLSPLAALFLGLVAVAAGIASAAHRGTAAVVGSVLLLAGVLTQLLFPSTGRMPFTMSDTVPIVLAAAVITCTCRVRVILAAVVVQLLVLPALLVVPGAIGTNITRLTWVCAVPVVVAYARLSRRKLAVAVAAVSVWPVSDLVQQLQASHDPSSAAAYYRPLSAALSAEQRAAGPAGAGGRLEVLDSANHWASVYLVDTVSLARGWDRQADVADNPIFYRPDALNSTSYRQWLADLAVWWVAVPNAPLDYASQQEARLLRAAPSYLRLAWQSSTWRLYRVLDPTPLATHAQIDRVDPTGVTLHTDKPAVIDLRVRWTPYFELRDATGEPVAACLTDRAGWTSLSVAKAGSYRLTTDFDLQHRSPPPCATTTTRRDLP